MRLCSQCGKILSKTEIKFYEVSCEGCEQAWSDRLNAWRKGEPDEELDLVYGDNRVKH